jgi:hypothetical protein
VEIIAFDEGQKMIKDSMENRKNKYFQIGSQLAHLKNIQLRNLFDNSESNESSTGWGSSHIIDFGQSKIFVKRIPVTNLEYDNNCRVESGGSSGDAGWLFSWVTAN